MEQLTTAHRLAEAVTLEPAAWTLGRSNSRLEIRRASRDMVMGTAVAQGLAFAESQPVRPAVVVIIVGKSCGRI